MYVCQPSVVVVVQFFAKFFLGVLCIKYLCKDTLVLSNTVATNTHKMVKSTSL